MKRNLSKKRFIEELEKIQDAIGEQKQTSYSDIHIKKSKYVSGIRDNSGAKFTINIDKLYEAYIHCDLSTTALKEYIGGVQSPGLAILKQIRNG